MKNHLLLTLLSIVLQIAASARHMGCYKEVSRESPLMKGDYKVYSYGTYLTPDRCIDHCKSLGFGYAGTQAGKECYCSHERPSFKYSAEESDCNMPCEGDTSKTCGSEWRLGVYDIEDKEVNHVGTYYEGCYVDSKDRMMPLGPSRSDINTAEFCAGLCFQNGYRFSGTEVGNECFCGDVLVGPPVADADCNYKCPGDTRIHCGDDWRLSVYATSISDESEAGRFVGCFVDNTENGLLSGYSLTLKATNSPRRCMNTCLQLGFDYAGVENGVECYCGSRRPDKEKLAKENECMLVCPDGVTRACGGKGRLGVYSTYALYKGNNSSELANGNLSGMETNVHFSEHSN